jgi:hypothetical protein
VNAQEAVGTLDQPSTVRLMIIFGLDHSGSA